MFLIINFLNWLLIYIIYRANKTYIHLYIKLIYPALISEIEFLCIERIYVNIYIIFIFC